MKKISCLLILFISTLCFVFAENGYNGLPWGSTVDKVKEKYPEIEQDTSATCEANETFYELEQGDVTRYFRFYNGGLYWVRVIYDDLNQTRFDSMTEKIKQVYGGEWLDMDLFEENNDTRRKFGYILIDKEDLFRDLYITVEVNNSINGFGAKLGEYVMATYSCPSMELELREAAMEDFEL